MPLSNKPLGSNRSGKGKGKQTQAGGERSQSQSQSESESQRPPQQSSPWSHAPSPSTPLAPLAPSTLRSAEELLAFAQERLGQLHVQAQLIAGQNAAELQELFTLRELPSSRAALLGFVVGVTDVVRLLELAGDLTLADLASCRVLRDDLLLAVARLTPAETEPSRAESSRVDLLGGLWRSPSPAPADGSAGGRS